MSLYRQKGSDIWWASITVDGERLRFSTGEYDRAAAQKVHDQRKAKQHDAPKLKGKTFGDAVLKWAQAQTRSESDLQSLAKFGKHYKDRLLSGVTAESIDKALCSFIKAEGTYNRYLTRINAVLALSGVKLKIAKKRDRKAKVRDWLTQEQWARLKAELPEHQRAMATFAILTGLRQANVLGLTWRKVDLARKMVWIEASEMKSARAIGVPLSTGAINVLKSVQGGHPEFVFTFRGEPIKEIKTAFQAACIRAGIGRMVAGTYSGFTWHGLRHTWATWHAQAGTPLEVLRVLGGWSDMRMLDRYAHHVPGLVGKFVNNIEEGDEE